MSDYLKYKERQNITQCKYRKLVFLFIVMLMLVACAAPISIARIRKGDLAQYTTPLDSETIQNICEEFELDEEIICQPDHIVYAPDFFPVILDYFREGEFTHEDVIAKLGRYEYNCEKPIYVPSLDKRYYSCAYDLNGDKVFPINVFYDIEEDRHVVTRIIATISDS